MTSIILNKHSMSKYYDFIKRLKIVIYIVRKSKLFAVSTLVMCFSSLSADAQNRLSDNIQLPKFEGATLRAIFDVLKQEQSVFFSYNSQLLNLDEEVNVDRYQGLLVGYLEKLLGEKYSFKETNSHIIITYAPQRMDVSTVDMDTIKNNRTKISGYVKDIRTNMPVKFVTVYDGTAYQFSTLTDKSGYFELDVKSLEPTFTIAMSKENYRDTALVLLLPVEVSRKGKERKTGYYHASDSSKMISNTAFGRFFTSSRQRVQNLNLGGFFVYSPFQISMTPGLSTHGFFNSQIVNKFSLNIIGGYTAGVTGTELAGAFNVNQFDMQGVQFAGLFNVVGGDVRGFQAAGVSNVGLNKLSGIQLAGIWNSIDTVTSGIQLTGGINLASNAERGIQLAGAMNLAKSEVGSQLAGGINIARKVHGVQLAVINIADSSDYPIGVFNWIKNGSRQLSLGFDESKFMGLSFRSGGRVMYSVLGIGTYLNDGYFKYGIEAGIGAHLIQRTRVTLSTELVHRTHFDEDLKYNDTNRSSLRIIPAINLSRHLQVYAAPSLTYSEAIHPELGNKGLIWKIWGADQRRNTFHGGGTVGLTYRF
ncbi:hypothetical protein C5745_02425 [Sphingobacterium haloxyli]|uniref:Carboxypeptidase-like regulatory domain-containing protein n=2 Tax=Sphingobacterium haloxyli TaxID=2100533 RepID=A0A2S9J7Q0_9SPHI|nr:hypothetical protein C5745_02425 [Sphingobacterium haloxyli]